MYNDGLMRLHVRMLVVSMHCCLGLQPVTGQLQGCGKQWTPARPLAHYLQSPTVSTVAACTAMTGHTRMPHAMESKQPGGYNGPHLVGEHASLAVSCA